jgi:hypothetical protein
MTLKEKEEKCIELRREEIKRKDRDILLIIWYYIGETE